MVIPIALTVVYVALVLVRMFAWRRVAATGTGTAWLLFSPQFFGPAMLLVVAATLLPTRPLLGLVLTLVGLGWGAIVVRTVRAVARGAASAKTFEERVNAAVEPSADYMLTMTVLSVMGLLVIGVAAIVWALASR